METPRKFITAKLSIRKPGSSSMLIICTDEDPGLRIESFAVINSRGVSTNKTIIYLIAMQTYKELIIYIVPNVGKFIYCVMQKFCDVTTSKVYLPNGI